MSENDTKGICHYCGEYRNLTPEHVPPKRCFNIGQYIQPRSQSVEYMNPDLEFRGKFVQGGMKYRALCEPCNNNSGNLYGNAYQKWVWTATSYLEKTRPKGIVELPFTIFPLEICKQIVGFFLTINPPEFGACFPHLRKFVVSPDVKGIPTCFNLYAYLTTSEKCRAAPIVTLASIRRPAVQYCSEISHFPFGYQLIYNSTSERNDMVCLNGFSKCERDRLTTLYLPFKWLPVETPLPNDYRTRAQIITDRDNNLARKTPSMTQDQKDELEQNLELASKTLVRLGMKDLIGVTSNKEIAGLMKPSTDGPDD